MFNLIPLPYKILGAVSAFILIISVSFGFGYHQGTAISDHVISAYSEQAVKQLDKLEERQQETNTKIVTKYITGVQKIHDKEIVYRDVAATSVPKQNQLSVGWIYEHDKAAQGLPLDPEKAKDPNPSGVYDNEALGTIASNYTICDKNSNQLIALQAWLNETQGNIKKK